MPTVDHGAITMPNHLVDESVTPIKAEPSVVRILDRMVGEHAKVYGPKTNANETKVHVVEMHKAVSAIVTVMVNV